MKNTIYRVMGKRGRITIPYAGKKTRIGILCHS